MPAPQAQQLEPLARNAVSNAGLDGEDAPRLAKAMAGLFAEVLGQFANQTQVLPGIPAAVDPTTTTGSTVGPGMLLPPPGGGPNAAMIEPIALGKLRDAGLEGQNIPDLAKVLAQVCEIGLTLLCAQAMVAPGLAVAGMVTTAPGRLM
jgi:hypothetical protein